mmetsp:Transcript_21044/g.70146  ORF Transcript_21044/g.70146 Transcript_21044/m.70146 type:complete len:245 (+) Transcript_21044:1466-2200(+)
MNENRESASVRLLSSQNECSSSAKKEPKTTSASRENGRTSNTVLRLPASSGCRKLPCISPNPAKVSGLLEGERALAMAPRPVSSSTISRKFFSSFSPHSEQMDSGWNCTPHSGSFLCRIPMIIPSAVHATSSRSTGNGSLLPSALHSAREWYRTTELPCGMSRKRRELLWNILLVRPCTAPPGARLTCIPYACPSPWNPRQTPRTGTGGSLSTFMQRPKSSCLSGRPGPGERMMEEKDLLADSV